MASIEGIVYLKLSLLRKSLELLLKGMLTIPTVRP